MSQQTQTQGTASTGTPTVVPVNTAAQAKRDAIVAELEQGLDAGAAAPSEPSAAPADTSASTEEPKPDGEDAPANDGAAEETAQSAPEPDAAAEPADEPADPALAKNVDAINRREKRSLEKVAAKQRELEQFQAKLEKEWAPRVEKVQRWEQLEARAKYDPAAVLEALGVDLHESGELVARQVYSRSKAAAANPQTREAAERALREREQVSTVSQLQKQLDEMRQEMTERDTRSQRQTEAQRYMSGFDKAVDDGAPLLRSYLANDRDEALESLAAVAVEIAEDTGERPDHGDVVKEWERRRVAQLKKLGLEPPTSAAKLNGNGKAASPPTKPGKTLSNDIGSPTKAPPKRDDVSPEQRNAEIARELEEMERARA